MRLTVLPGDGIGPEITSAALQVIEHVKRAFALDVTIDVHEIGLVALQRTGTTLATAGPDAGARRARCVPPRRRRDTRTGIDRQLSAARSGWRECVRCAAHRARLVRPRPPP